MQHYVDDEKLIMKESFLVFFLRKYKLNNLFFIYQFSFYSLNVLMVNGKLILGDFFYCIASKVNSPFTNVIHVQFTVK